MVEVSQSEILDRIGPSLVVTAITEDRAFIDELLNSPHVERLNVGAIPTHQISWINHTRAICSNTCIGNARHLMANALEGI